jgi:Fic family protein
MKITSPPVYESTHLFQISLQKNLQGVKSTITDGKERYLHWNKLQYLETPRQFEDIQEYWFFIKHSRILQYKHLPFVENFVYILTDEIQENLHHIDSQLRGSVEAQHIDNNKNKYIIHSLFDEAISSSQLEGAATTRKVAQEMLRTKRQPKNHSEAMIYNNYQAIKFIIEHQSDNLTPKMILELHNITTHNTLENPNDAGKLRVNNTIGVYDDQTNAKLHTPPSWESLPERLQLLCDFANNKSPHYFIHPVVRAILVHFILAYDHPFADGNGRTARALFYWIMLKNNYWMFEYITLSTYIKKSISQYGKSFLEVETDDFDTTYFINSQLAFIQIAITKLFKYIENKQQEFQKAFNLLKKYLQNNTLNSRQVLFVHQSIKNPGSIYTIDGYKTMHNIGYDSARKDLMKLVTLKLLLQSKKGREFVFIVPNNVEEIINNA